MKPQWIFFIIFAIAGGVCVLILAPAIEASLTDSDKATPISMFAFSRLCHQDPARSFKISGVCLSVCARCSGIYLGFFIGWVIWRLFPFQMRDRPINSRDLIIGLAPMVLDGLGNVLGLFSSPMLIRFFTGLLFGAVAARALWPALVGAAGILFSMEDNTNKSVNIGESQ